MPPDLYPNPPVLVNFIRLFMQAKIFRWTLNSGIVAGSVTASNLFLGTLAGYALAKKKFHGRIFTFWLIVSMMMVPYQLTIVPLFIIINKLNWMSTYWALIVPSLSGPFAIFLMKQYLQTLPSELIDAARIDGCNEFGIFLRIILPLKGITIGAIKG
jgi:multiple sugar transport system permease protein